MASPAEILSQDTCEEAQGTETLDIPHMDVLVDNV